MRSPIKILDATLDVIIERGFRGATIVAIADVAGGGGNPLLRRWIDPAIVSLTPS